MPSASRLPNDVRSVVSSVIANASRVVRDELNRVKVMIKEDGSPVTSVDLAVELSIRSQLEKAFPDHGICGEECDPHNPDAQWVWLIDPIDGTRQFAAGLPNYGILLTLCEDITPRLGVICQPILGDIYLGISGEGAWLNEVPIRTAITENIGDAIVCYSDPDAFDESTRPGFESLRPLSRWNVYDGGCLSFASLAAGQIGVSVCGPNLDNYDFCALVPVVEGAGGMITNWNGRPLDRESKGPIIASCSSTLHARVLEILQ
ncbi:MAG: histidinol-phosphatase [marine bacterium B5-7]|nr:MAG: histidinol-phosphatase [marine bacterium B5-7]